ncbi:hypothetical protein EC844_10655 [Acinetobacter calcoaceticus]|uniref:Uncharacterized protein n=1 Tax=Acinetobacter calcoaceticus TaxID=471 RepID=A0A4R1Y791_ACICA|nr:hypothetical protein EC844_10655 [Acinetobacter calcoaceticus]
MLKLLLKVLTFVAVIFLILFMLMWGFHGFATKPTRDLPDPEHSLVMPHSTEQKLQAFLIPALS